MDISRKLCPYCGKTLRLMPPSREYLPHTMGVSANGIEFRMCDTYRYDSYTKQPIANKSYQPTAKIASLEHSNIWMKQNDVYIDFHRKTAPVGLVPTIYVRNQIKKGGNALLHRRMVFQCEKCFNIVAINENPYFNKAGGIMVFLWLLTLMLYVIAALLITSGIVPHPLILLLLPIPALIATIIFLILMLISFQKIKHTNNFAPVDEFDNLVKMPALITVSSCIPEEYRQEANIFSTKVGGKVFRLYAASIKESSIDLYICGVDGEQERMLDLLKDQGSSLTLSFEDREIGSVQVMKIHDMPEELISSEDLKPSSLFEWRCAGCGYTNPSNASECKSCGRYR
ncbi:MAG: hypothetical protein IJZ47_08060 [Oscillospiraceae bacterium]|nr:hypothetical protein [Oscillospiraceae bacterium]